MHVKDVSIALSMDLLAARIAILALSSAIVPSLAKRKTPQASSSLAPPPLSTLTPMLSSTSISRWTVSSVVSFAR